jgi:hypothetical protein
VLKIGPYGLLKRFLSIFPHYKAKKGSKYAILYQFDQHFFFPQLKNGYPPPFRLGSPKFPTLCPPLKSLTPPNPPIANYDHVNSIFDRNNYPGKKMFLIRYSLVEVISQQYFGIDCNSAVPSSLLIAPVLQTIEFLLFYNIWTV